MTTNPDPLNTDFEWSVGEMKDNVAVLREGVEDVQCIAVLALRSILREANIGAIVPRSLEVYANGSVNLTFIDTVSNTRMIFRYRGSQLSDTENSN